MSQDPLKTPYQQFIHRSKYARWLPEKGRRETWEETVWRYVDYWWNRGVITPSERLALFTAIYNLEVMPSMRALMTAGAALDRDVTAGYNCSFIAVGGSGKDITIEHPDLDQPYILHVGSPIDFDEILYVLMCGTGVGYSVERQYINRLPVVGDSLNRSIYAPTEENFPGVPADELSVFLSAENRIVVADSKCGWASALRILLVELYNGNFDVTWDVSQVRPAGARLKTFGGRASGPEPLLRLFDYCVQLFRAAEGRRLNSIECHGLVCKIADIVVVGGVRRSALLSLSNLSDNRMRHAKTGSWWIENPHFSLANNSVAFTEKPTAGAFMAEWLSLYDSKSGERGIFNRQAATKLQPARRAALGYNEWGTNPCSEIVLRSRQKCNLSEVVVRPSDTQETLFYKIEIAAILGTLQATLTDFRYLSPKWKENCEEERLLGVSLTGIMDHPLLSTVSEESGRLLRGLRDHAVTINQLWADALEINPATAVTCVKPSGTVSQLVDAASGIHPRYAPHYIRTVRADKKDPLAQLMRDQGVPCEDDVMRPDSTWVFSFPVEAPAGSVFRDDRSALEQLELWKHYQLNFCEHKPSCFSAKTRFITDQGLVSFEEVLAGRETAEVKVLNKVGEFVPATVNRFGRQEIWEITLTSGKKSFTLETTADHLWPVTYHHQRWAGWDEKLYQTKSLPIGKQFVSVYQKTDYNSFALEGFLHGVVFGDGTEYNKHRANSHCRVDLCGDKGPDLVPFFEKFGLSATTNKAGNMQSVYRLPNHWKTLPDILEESSEYLRGFIMGWFATDGYVDRKGAAFSISSSRREYLEWLQAAAPKAGIGVSVNLQQGVSGATAYANVRNPEIDRTFYWVCFLKESLSKDFFVRAKHKDRFTVTEQSSKRWKISQVRNTGRLEEVFCVTEPVGHHFVLEGNILTHNCTVYVKEHEWPAVGAWVYDNFDIVSGISFLPHSDHSYQQAPYQEVDELTYKTALAVFPEIDWDQLREEDDQTTGSQEYACVGGACELT
jgi:ribonucleoside-diphosphate reductase alpha chain